MEPFPTLDLKGTPWNFLPYLLYVLLILSKLELISWVSPFNYELMKLGFILYFTFLVQTIP